jgi:riboflavin transporter FmnP
MNTFVLLPLQKSMAQHGAGKHDQWRRYMTVSVVNHGIIKSISILTAVIRAIIKFDVDKPRDCFCQEVKWTLANR